MRLTTPPSTAAIPLAEAALLGSFYSDWLADRGELRGLLSPEWLPSRWSAPDPRLTGSEARALAWKSVLEYNRGLGAPPVRVDAAASAGEAVITGQQPGHLGGPAFNLYKIATAIALARRASRDRSRAVSPLFWMVADDSDFAEMRTGRLCRDLELPGSTLPPGMHQPRQMVGTLDVEMLHGIGRRFVEECGGPHAAWVIAALDRARSKARDAGDYYAALLLEIFSEYGLLVVDARSRELRVASVPVFDRYLERREEVVRALADAAAEVRARGYDVSIEPASGEHSLYQVEGNFRLRWEFPADPAVARADLVGRAGGISSNVVLRPLAQDEVLPILAQVVGPGEAAYFQQVRRVNGVLGARAAALFPRLSLSWWPPEAQSVAAALRCPERALLTELDATLRSYHWSQVPPGVRSETDSMAGELASWAERMSAAARGLDASLPQLVESARGKMDYQLSRLHDGLLSKVKSHAERDRPRLGRLKGFLLPQEKLQERAMSALAPLVQVGPALVPMLVALAERHVDDTLQGRSSHYLEPWEG